MTTLAIDVETFSSIDLTKAGVARYVEAPDFEITVFAYAYGDSSVNVIDLAQGQEVPQHVMRDLVDPSVTKAAFNSVFELATIGKHFNLKLDPAQWKCTQVHALYTGLPAALGNVAKVVGLPEDKQKMTVGYSLIRYFCVPCRPTKANGGRTRNLPKHDQAKWSLFLEYAGRDVEAEREIARRLSRFVVPKEEHDLWVLDQRMNATGIQLDAQLVANAIECDAEVKARLTAEAIKLTGLANPSSRKQLLAWLVAEEDDDTIVDLKKATIPELLDKTDSDVVKRVLELRQELSKTSVAKYTAMARGVCADGAIRGLTQFYGANRTGRFAGRLVQFGNLARNYLIDLDLARNLVKDGNYELLELLFGTVPDTLSQLIRTAFIARPGKKLVVIDFSAIEARVIAWMAWCQWRLDVFSTHGKIYEASAEQMFRLPPGSVTKKSPYRQKGKVAELACFAADTKVLTKRGPKTIIEIDNADLLWDGVEWVKSEGVVCQGPKKTITLCGVSVTPDHLIKTGRTWTQAQQLASNENTLRQALATGSENLRSCQLSAREKGLAILKWSAFNVPAGLLRILYSTTTSVRDLVLDATNALRSKLGFGARHFISTLRLAQTTITGGGFSTGYPLAGAGATARTTQTTPITGDGASGYTPPGTKIKPHFSDTSSRFQGGITQSSTWIGLMSTRATNQETSGSLPGSRTRATDDPYKRCSDTSESLKPVFDILNSGPRNTFTVLTNRGPLLVHNCGYQGGTGALIAMGALKMGLAEEDLKPIINQWRAANPEIASFDRARPGIWLKVDSAATKAVRNKTSVTLPIAGGRASLVFAYESGFLTIKLPSERKLFYCKPRLEQEDLYRALANGAKYVVAEAGSLTYEGNDQKTKKWMRLPTYGGKLVENIVQAIARDCLREAMFALDRAGFTQLTTVHDEIICEEAHEGSLNVERAEELLGLPVAWAPGLLLRGAGFETPYYMKEID